MKVETQFPRKVEIQFPRKVEVQFARKVEAQFPMKIIPKRVEIVKGDVFPGGEDRAMLESNLSASPAHRGMHRPFFDAPVGFNAINSPSFPPVGLFLIVSNSDNRVTIRVCAAFRQYCYALEQKPCTFLHMRHKVDKSTVLYRRTGYSDSRYYPSGRAAIIKKIRRRLRSEQMEGIFFTLTVDPKRYDMAEAWRRMWPQWNRFKDALNVYRKWHMNAKHGIYYLAALEQHESGYPHLHVYCPGLQWLIKRRDLGKMDDWWGMGSANTKKERRQDSAVGYVTKYISKLEGWSELSMALLWHYEVRLYNMSRCYSKGKQDSEWEVLDIFGNLEELSEGLNIKIKDAESLLEAFSGVGADLVYLKPPEEARNPA